MLKELKIFQTVIERLVILQSPGNLHPEPKSRLPESDAFDYSYRYFPDETKFLKKELTMPCNDKNKSRKGSIKKKSKKKSKRK